MVTGAVPFPPRYLPPFFIAHRVQHSQVCVASLAIFRVRASFSPSGISNSITGSHDHLPDLLRVKDIHGLLAGSNCDLRDPQQLACGIQLSPVRIPDRLSGSTAMSPIIQRIPGLEVDGYGYCLQYQGQCHPPTANSKTKSETITANVNKLL